MTSDPTEATDVHQLLDQHYNLPVDEMDMNVDDDDLPSNNDELDSDEQPDNEDDDDDNMISLPPMTFMNDMISIADIQKSYACLITQLREEFNVPKNVTQTITTHIVSLLENIGLLLEQKGASPPVPVIDNSVANMSDKTNQKLIDCCHMQHTIRDICQSIEDITRNDYQFLKYCETFFNYRAPREIVLSDPAKKRECGYFIPVDETLSSILHGHDMLTDLARTVTQQQQTVNDDDDIMFSFRDGTFGTHIDDDSFLIQIYTDDIGLTNPIGAKRDQHKMTMVYFALEDVPNHYRSKLDYIYLLGICPKKALQVKKA
jgi:hypothetical protein